MVGIYLDGSTSDFFVIKRKFRPMGIALAIGLLLFGIVGNNLLIKNIIARPRPIYSDSILLGYAQNFLPEIWFHLFLNLPVFRLWVDIPSAFLFCDHNKHLPSEANSTFNYFCNPGFFLSYLLWVSLSNRRDRRLNIRYFSVFPRGHYIQKNHFHFKEQKCESIAI